jgi:hypothetical protein
MSVRRKLPESAMGHLALRLVALSPLVLGIGQAGFQMGERAGVVHASNPDAAVWPGHRGLPFSLALEQVFGVDTAPAQAMLGRVGPSAIDVDTGGNLYVRDPDFGRLVSFRPDGSVRWSAGRKGPGPGEIQGAGHLAVADGSVFLLEQQGTRFDIWSPEGEYLRSETLAALGVARSRLAGYQPPGFLILNRTTASALGTEVTVIDVREAWRVIGDFEVVVSAGAFEPSRARSTVINANVDDRYVWVGNNGEYLLRAFSHQGELRRTISTGAEYLRRPGFFNEGGRIAFVHLGELAAPIRLSSGHLLVFASWPMNVDDPDAFAGLSVTSGERPEVQWACSLDVFDADGRFLGSSVWEGMREPEVGRPALGEHGKLYTVALDPFPQVRRYRVEF